MENLHLLDFRRARKGGGPDRGPNALSGNLSFEGGGRGFHGANHPWRDARPELLGSVGETTRGTHVAGAEPRYDEATHGRFGISRHRGQGEEREPILVLPVQVIIRMMRTLAGERRS